MDPSKSLLGSLQRPWKLETLRFKRLPSKKKSAVHRDSLRFTDTSPNSIPVQMNPEEEFRNKLKDLPRLKILSYSPTVEDYPQLSNEQDTRKSNYIQNEKHQRKSKQEDSSFENVENEENDPMDIDR